MPFLKTMPENELEEILAGPWPSTVLDGFYTGGAGIHLFRIRLYAALFQSHAAARIIYAGSWQRRII